MKMIQLTYKGEKLRMDKTEAVGLHRELSMAMKKAGIDAEAYRTVEAPGGVEMFTQNRIPLLTDC